MFLDVNSLKQQSQRRLLKGWAQSVPILTTAASPCLEKRRDDSLGLHQALEGSPGTQSTPPSQEASLGPQGQSGGMERVCHAGSGPYTLESGLGHFRGTVGGTLFVEPERKANGSRKSGSRTEKERQLRSDPQALSRGHGRALHMSDPTTHHTGTAQEDLGRGQAVGADRGSCPASLLYTGGN